MNEDNKPKKKKKRKLCNEIGCTNLAKNHQKCFSHGAVRKICDEIGCEKLAQSKGKCCTHRIEDKICDVIECNNLVRSKGKCDFHNNNERKKCDEIGCENIAQSKGKCYAHSDTQRKICDEIGCENQAQNKGKCDSHDPNTICIITDCNLHKVPCYSYCIEHNIFTLEEYAKYRFQAYEHSDKCAQFDITNIITAEQIVELCNNENNKCHFCKRFLLYENSLTYRQLSVDRINNSIGHESGNVNITCRFCNRAKSTAEEEDYIMFMDALKFGKIPNFDKEEISTRWLRAQIDGAEKRHKELLQKFNLNPIEYPCITKEWIINELKDKKYISPYSGIPIFNSTKNRYPFKGSIDRIDNLKPYTPDNCAIVCHAENMGRNELPLENYLQIIQEIRATE